jgi:hypothetical protein
MSLSAARAPGEMERRAHWHAQNRGTILVASTDSAFVGIVGALVAASGFTPAYPTDREAPWVSVTRTHPCLAICDGDVPGERIRHLVLEAWARHVPVLVSATEQPMDARSLKPRRVARFTLPVSREAFRSLLDGLLQSVTASRAPHDADRRRGPRGQLDSRSTLAKQQNNQSSTTAIRRRPTDTR